MKASAFLYGAEPEEWVYLPYIISVEKKIFLSSKLLNELLAVPYQERDDYRIREVREAIKFNEYLIKETVK